MKRLITSEAIEDGGYVVLFLTDDESQHNDLFLSAIPNDDCEEDTDFYHNGYCYKYCLKIFIGCEGPTLIDFEV